MTTMPMPSRPEPETKKREKPRKSTVPRLLQQTYQSAKQAQEAYQHEDGKWHAALVKFRTLANMTIPGFERIMMASKVAQEGENKAFLKKMLGR